MTILSIPLDRLKAEALNLTAHSPVQWPEFTTGCGHVWRLVGKNCNPFVSRRDSLNHLQVNLLDRDGRQLRLDGKALA